MEASIEVKKSGAVAEVVLIKPSLDLDMLKSMADHFTTLAVDDSVRAVVITGKGKFFCIGGDLKWVTNHPAGPKAGFHELAGRLHQAFIEIRRMKKPVIAAVNATAAGAGLSLACACDFRVMARSARFVQAYTSRGLVLDGGGTFTLPRLVGFARAMEITAFDEPISSEQALEWGLATKVVDDEKVLEEALNMADKLVKRSVHSFGLVKQLMTDSFDTSFETQLDLERKALTECGGHPDGQEGMKSFFEKRDPVFYTSE